jgi:AraC-like DNA-binding protein
MQRESAKVDANMTPTVEPVAVTTDNPESVGPTLRRLWSNKVVVPRERGPIGYELKALSSPRFTVGKVTCRVARTSRAVVTQPMLQIPLDGAADYRVGRAKISLSPGEAILLPPGHEYTAHADAGPVLFLQIDTAVLVSGLPAGRGGRSRHWAMRCVPIDVSQAHGIDVLGEVDSLLQAQASPSYGGRSAEFTDLERRVVAWLKGALFDCGGLRSFVPAGSMLAERAGEWIESNLSGPITLESMASQFRVTGRWLQNCFLARWGVAPMDYVMYRRLALARSFLTSPDDPSVTGAAIRSGFSHLGRFAGLYRRTYGESPSETIARVTMGRQPSPVARPMEARAHVPSIRQCASAP